ncbi:unnamed protein product [Thelazia callipaeda]|uniref:Spondin domain-containing protein n=1 Tax=Thelazia callipaeda TaxID=103827 RepID=A0A0N5CRU4_THECL|nr:unnamed protein product [Thelazia callipaeda]
MCPDKWPSDDKCGSEGFDETVWAQTVTTPLPDSDDSLSTPKPSGLNLTLGVPGPQLNASTQQKFQAQNNPPLPPVMKVLVASNEPEMTVASEVTHWPTRRLFAKVPNPADYPGLGFLQQNYTWYKIGRFMYAREYAIDEEERDAKSASVVDRRRRALPRIAEHSENMDGMNVDDRIL